MNITVSGTCKLVLLLESDDQCLRKQHIKMFPCVNMHQRLQWKKNLPDALALTNNELCKEMALNWKCEHLHKKHLDVDIVNTKLRGISRYLSGNFWRAEQQVVHSAGARVNPAVLKTQQYHYPTIHLHLLTTTHSCTLANNHTLTYIC